MNTNQNKILAFATKGSKSNDEKRLTSLLGNLEYRLFPFQYENKVRSFFSLFREIYNYHPNLIIMEGSGFAGGFALLLSKLFFRIPYIFSSGDAIAPFLSQKFKLPSLFFLWYEVLLYKFCKGFIGWTPYLVGRALTFGAPKGITIEGWANFSITDIEKKNTILMRSQLGIPEDAIVFGIIGTISWNPHVSYAYGLELIEALQKSKNNSVYVLIIGSGDGIPLLKKKIRKEFDQKIIFTGEIAHNKISEYLPIINIASLPISADSVGSYRYTYKISEYISCQLPIITSQVPAAYDLLDCNLFRIGGKHPWSKTYIDHIAKLMDNINQLKILNNKNIKSSKEVMFNKKFQIEKFQMFIKEITSEHRYEQ